jgi:hypothetical protein
MASPSASALPVKWLNLQHKATLRTVTGIVHEMNNPLDVHSVNNVWIPLFVGIVDAARGK